MAARFFAWVKTETLLEPEATGSYKSQVASTTLAAAAVVALIANKGLYNFRNILQFHSRGLLSPKNTSTIIITTLSLPALLVLESTKILALLKLILLH